MPDFASKPAATYTTVDLNASGTTSVFSGTKAAVVHGAYMQNGGTSAVVQLEITDGSDTAVLTPGQTAGDGIAFTGSPEISPTESLQTNVTTVEGAAQSNTLVVLVSE